MRSTDEAEPRVVSLARSAGHRFSKEVVATIRLLAGEGVEGDAHCGKTVRHRSRVAVDPTPPNLRQVHLIARELLVELHGLGYELNPGDLGENILTSGLTLIDLPRGTRLSFGGRAEIGLTGLRNPCHQIEDFRGGLLRHMVGRGTDERRILKTGVMAIVVNGGTISAGNPIAVSLPPEPHRPLERV